MAVNLYKLAATGKQWLEYWSQANEARTTNIEDLRAEIFSYMQDYVNPVVLKQFQDDQGNFIVDEELPLLETDTPVVRDLKVMLNALYLADYANDSSVATKLTALYKNAGGFEGAGAGKQFESELTSAYAGMSTEAFTRFEAMKGHFSEGTGLDVEKLQVLAKNQVRLLDDEDKSISSDREIEIRLEKMRADFIAALSPDIREELGMSNASGLYKVKKADRPVVRNAKVMLNLMAKAPSAYEAQDKFRHRDKTGPVPVNKARKAYYGLPLIIQMKKMERDAKRVDQDPLKESIKSIKKQADALVVEELSRVDKLETDLGLRPRVLLQEAEREVMSKIGLPTYYHDAISQRREEYQKSNESQIKDASQKLAQLELSAEIFKKNERFYSVSAEDAQAILNQLGDKADPKYKALLEDRAKNQESWARWAWNNVPAVSPVTYSEEDYLHGQAAKTIQQMLREQQQDLAILNQKQAILEEKMRGEVNQPQPNATLFQYHYLEHRVEELRARIELLESEDVQREKEQDSFMAYDDMITGHDSVNLNKGTIEILQEKVAYCENKIAVLGAELGIEQKEKEIVEETAELSEDQGWWQQAKDWLFGAQEFENDVITGQGQQPVAKSISDEKLEVENNVGDINEVHAEAAQEVHVEAAQEKQVSSTVSKNLFVVFFKKAFDFFKGLPGDIEHLRKGPVILTGDNVSNKMPVAEKDVVADWKKSIPENLPEKYNRIQDDLLEIWRKKEARNPGGKFDAKAYEDLVRIHASLFHLLYRIDENKDLVSDYESFRDKVKTQMETVGEFVKESNLSAQERQKIDAQTVREAIEQATSRTANEKQVMRTGLSAEEKKSLLDEEQDKPRIGPEVF